MDKHFYHHFFIIKYGHLGTGDGSTKHTRDPGWKRRLSPSWMLSMSSWRLGLVESMLLDLQRKNTPGKKLIGKFKQPWLHLVWWLRCWIMLDIIETLWFSIQEVYLVLVKNHGTLDPQVDRFEGSEVIPEAATKFRFFQRFRGLLKAMEQWFPSLVGLGFASSFVFWTPRHPNSWNLNTHPHMPSCWVPRTGTRRATQGWPCAGLHIWLRASSGALPR